MSMTDPIADMLTRIRNASSMRSETVSMPASKTKNAILEVLVNEGFIEGFKNETNENKTVTTVTLKYAQGQSVIRGLKRVSKVGLRVYAKAEELPQVPVLLGPSRSTYFSLPFLPRDTFITQCSMSTLGSLVSIGRVVLLPFM